MIRRGLSGMDIVQAAGVRAALEIRLIRKDP